jgi:serine/threonine protein kinase
MTPPHSDSSSSSFTSLSGDIEQIQHWIDHPSLDSTLHRVPANQRARLESDQLRCIELLKIGPRIAEGPLANELRFDQPQLVGAGSFGLVFRAWDRQLKRDVAIKLLRPSVPLTQHMQSRFALEAEALARCRVEGIIPVYDCGSLEGNPYLVTGYIPGPSLAEYCRKHPMPMDIRLACELLHKIALAVHEAHRRGILHRDLKPSNILLETMEDRDCRGKFCYQPYVSDFGLAKDNSDEAESSSGNRSSEKVIVGTIRYMSPEQAVGDRSAISIESDVYSLGVILFELITGQCPHVAQSKQEALEKIAYSEAPSARTKRPDIPPELDAVIAKCLALQRAQRYSSAESLADDLKRFLDGRPTQAASSGIFRTMWLWIRRHPAWTMLWISIWTSMLGTSIVVYSLYREKSQLLAAERAARNRSEGNKANWLRSIQDMYRFMAETTIRDKPRSSAGMVELQLKALQHCEQFAEVSHHDEQSMHLLSIAHHYLSCAYFSHEQIDEAREHRKRCLKLIEELIEIAPSRPGYHFDRFMSLYLLSDLDSETDLEGRLRHVQESLISLERAIELSPPNIDYQDALAAAWYKLAVNLPDRESAEGYCVQAIDLSKSLYEDHPKKPFLAKYAISGHLWMAERNIEKNDLPRARWHVEQSLDYWTRAFGELAPSVDTLLLESPIHEQRARIAAKLALPETEQYFREAIRSRRELCEAWGKPELAQLGEAYLVTQLVEYLETNGKAAQASEERMRAKSLIANLEPGTSNIDVLRDIQERLSRFP